MKLVARLLICFSALFFATVAIAQDAAGGQRKAPIPVEVLFGNNRVAIQVTVNRKFNESTKFGVYANTMAAGDYNNKLDNKNQIDKGSNDTESMNSLYLTYDLYKGLGLVSGAGLNSSWGFRPFAGARYGIAHQAVSVNLSSGFYLTQSNNSETKVSLQFRPRLIEDWSLLTIVQGLYSHNLDTKKHDRGALYGRLGVGYKAVGFGFASNLDWYGPNKVLKENYGVFVSYAFR